MAIEKKIKILGAVLELPAKSSIANSAYSPRKPAKWAELAVLFSWQLQNRPHIFDFFQLPWVPIIHLSLFLLSIECPNSSRIINQFKAGCLSNRTILITLLRVPYLCHFVSASFVLPIRPFVPVL